jgi:hypothetical protein
LPYGFGISFIEVTKKQRQEKQEQRWIMEGGVAFRAGCECLLAVVEV